MSSHQAPTLLDYQHPSVQFVIARCAYGHAIDTAFVRHVRAARAAGKPVGAYLFVRHGTNERSDPRAQADAALEALRQAEWSHRDGLLWLDLEDNKQFDGPFDRTRGLRIYREVVQLCEAEWRCGIYVAPFWWSDVLGKPADLAQMPWWIANWSRSPTVPAGAPKPYLWQYGLTNAKRAGSAALVAVDGNVAREWPTQLVSDPPESPTPAQPDMVSVPRALVEQTRALSAAWGAWEPPT